MSSIYLAGPDVFYTNYVQVFEALVEDCAKAGFIGLVPSDGGLSRGLPATVDVANLIYFENLALIKSADAIIANVSPFRGVEPDSGTVFEIGFAKALGKVVVMYSNEPLDSLFDRVQKDCGTCTTDASSGMPVDPKYGYFVENFNNPLNLMLSATIPYVRGGHKEAIAKVKELLGDRA